MEIYPLKQLNFYRVKKDFTSDLGYLGSDVFKKDLIIQYQKSVSNTHDMLEMCHFQVYKTNVVLIWKTRVENLYDHWQEYLEPVPNPFI